MKKVLSIILALTMILSMTTLVGAAGNPFVDVSENAWYYDGVVTAVDMGLVNGKAPDRYAPDDFITYAETIKLAACMNEYYASKKVTLQNGTPWYQTYVDYCMDKEIIVKSANYNYSAYATREEFFKIFAHALPEEEFEPINDVPNDSIPDYHSGNMYAKEIYMLYRAGILAGVNDKHELNPKTNIKRSEVAVIITRMMDESKRVEFDVPVNKIENNDEIKDVEINEENKAEEFENKPTAEPVPTPSDDPIISGTDVEIDPEKYPAVVVKPEDSDKYDFESDNSNLTISILTIYKQPEGSEAEEYGSKYELEVQVYGGKPPYTYEWQYNGYRNQKTKIENGDYAKDADSAALILSIEKENTLLGQPISCKITDSEGTTVTTDAVKVYGPFSMPVDESLSDSGNNVLTGRAQDGILKKGEKVSVIRNGKVIAIGVAEDLQMFNKSLDETVKGDNVGIVFNREDGVRPMSGDIVVKYQPTHVIDTSDIVN